MDLSATTQLQSQGLKMKFVLASWFLAGGCHAIVNFRLALMLAAFRVIDSFHIQNRTYGDVYRNSP